MAQLLRFREYVEAANRARQRAQSERNPHAKQILQEIERSYHRLVEFEKWAVDRQQCNRPLLISGCSTVVRTSLRQIKTEDYWQGLARDSCEQ